MPPIETATSLLILWAVIGYLMGSVPFGMLVARALNLGNLREIGSGNIGATNVLRTGNKLAAFLTLVLDAGKGGIAVLIARALFAEDAAQLAGFFAFLGHLFPVWLGFKGGKGVATFLGTLLALSFPLGAAACATWAAVAAVFRISWLSAIVAALLAPVWAVVFYHWHGAVLVALMTVLILVKHRENIARLRAGTEPRIGAKR